MELNKIYESIVELDGDCLSTIESPPCGLCPFYHKCVKMMWREAAHISQEKRLNWALDELVEGFIFEDET